MEVCVALWLLQCSICVGFIIVPHRNIFVLPSRSILRTSPTASNYPIDFSDGIDLSPEQDKSVLKIITKSGDKSQGCADELDRVVMQWTVFDAEGRRLHCTDSQSLKVFEFLIQRAKSEVVPAWEWVARSMLKGERAVVFAAAKTAFGSLGAPPTIPPNTDLICEFNMVDIIRHCVSNISILHEGEDVLANAAAKVREGWLHNDEKRAISKRKADMKIRPSDHVIENQTSAVHSMNFTSQSSENIDRSDNNTVSPNAKRFFDPSKHQLDPNREIFGSSFGHRWKESADVIEIDILLPPTTSKKDLQVQIK